MGLDSYIYLIKKPRLNKKKFNEQETKVLVSDHDISFTKSHELEEEDAEKVTVTHRYFNFQKYIKSKYPELKESDIELTGYSYDSIAYRVNDKYNTIKVSESDWEGPCSYLEEEERYAYQCDELAYWRKNWAIVDIIGEYLNTTIGDCEYYYLDLDDLEAIKEIAENKELDEDYTEDDKKYTLSELERVLRVEPDHVYFYNWW